MEARAFVFLRSTMLSEPAPCAHKQSAISPRPGSWLMVGVEWHAQEELFCSGGWKTLLKQSAKVQPLSRKEECCVARIL